MLIPYSKYVKILKYLTLSLLAYIVTAIIVGGNLDKILLASIIPHFEFTPAFAIMFVAIFGATLTNIQTADQAAKSVQPLVKTFPYAGEISKTIVAVGVIGTGLLAIPVMAGASAYALSDAFGWKQGLSKVLHVLGIFIR